MNERIELLNRNIERYKIILDLRKSIETCNENKDVDCDVCVGLEFAIAIVERRVEAQRHARKGRTKFCCVLCKYLPFGQFRGVGLCYAEDIERNQELGNKMVTIEFEYYEPLVVATMAEAEALVKYYNEECDEICWIAEQKGNENE